MALQSDTSLILLEALFLAMHLPLVSILKTCRCQNIVCVSLIFTVKDAIVCQEVPSVLRLSFPVHHPGAHFERRRTNNWMTYEGEDNWIMLSQHFCRNLDKCKE